MSLQFYRLLHIIGIIGTFSALSGVIVFVANGGTKAENKFRKWIAIVHGVGLVLLLISGFGMLHKLNLEFPLWAVIKLIIWLFLGAAIAIGYRKPALASKLWWCVLCLGVIAAALGLLHN